MCPTAGHRLSLRVLIIIFKFRGMREHTEARLAARAWLGACFTRTALLAHRAQRGLSAECRRGGVASRPLRRLLRASEVAD